MPGGRPVFSRTEQEWVEAKVVRRRILGTEVMWWERRRARWGIFLGRGGNGEEGVKSGLGCYGWIFCGGNGEHTSG